MSAYTSPSTNHFEWIDTAKGFGILCVVLGHAYVSGWVHDSVYLFHMPLFFFLSGYLFRPLPDVKVYCKKKFYHLMVPYFSVDAIVILVLGLVYVFARIHTPFHDQISQSLSLLKNFTGSMRAVSWFFPCLFFPQQIMNLLARGRRIWLATFTVLLLLSASYAYVARFPGRKLPLFAEVVGMSLAFFAAGLLWKHFDKWKTIIGIAAAAGTIVSAFCIARGLNISWNLHQHSFGIPLVTLLLSLCCVIVVCHLCMYAQRVRFLTTVFSYFGTYSMGIMLFNFATIKVLGEIAPGLNSALVFCVAVFFSVILTLFLMRFSIFRALLFGSEKDVVQLTARFSPRGGGQQS